MFLLRVIKRDNMNILKNTTHRVRIKDVWYDAIFCKVDYEYLVDMGYPHLSCMDECQIDEINVL